MRTVRNVFLGAIEGISVTVLVLMQWWILLIIVLAILISIEMYLCSWTHASRSCAAQRKKELKKEIQMKYV